MSDTYQSRVFTFISSRTNQLKNNCSQGLRHLRVAVVWGGQILLYPFHLLTQHKIFQPQLSTPPAQTLLTEPTPDINIEQALELVELVKYPIEIAEVGAVTFDDWSFIDHSLPNLSNGEIVTTSAEVTAIKPTIQGLSSLLVDRQLVLVTTENQLLNVLTIPQQQEIRRRIGLDLATSWYRWYQNSLLDRHTPKALPNSNNTIPVDRQISPESLFDRLRNWFEQSHHQSPIETNLLPVAHQQLLLNSSTTIPVDRQIPSENLFDRLRNWFEQSHHQAPIETDIDKSISPSIAPQQLLLNSSTTIPVDRQIPSESLFDRLRNWFDRSHHQSLIIEPNIIESKIDRTIPTEPARQLAPSPYTFNFQPPRFDRYLDLPQLPPITEHSQSPAIESGGKLPLTNIVPKIQPNWLKNWWSYYREYITIPDQSENSIVHQPDEFKLTPIEPIPNQIKPKQQSRIPQSTETKITTKSARNIEYHPDWIETEAKTVGYSKSIIARILAWIDRLIFSIENWILSIISR